MKTEFNTRYGLLKGISAFSLYSDGALAECELNSPFEIATAYGRLIPKYQSGIRHKDNSSITFHNNGVIKYLYLQERKVIDTNAGLFPAEYLTFYEDGTLKRVFPLNGKLSGYWLEEDEFELAEELTFNLSIASLTCKVIGILFYKSGNIKSLTLWPKTRIVINTPSGSVNVRTGLSLYENGNIKSVEPAIPVRINTPIGTLSAYDIQASGINGDKNSLSFYKSGELLGITTSSDIIEIYDSTERIKVYEPKAVPSVLVGDHKELKPLKVKFAHRRVKFNDEDEYEIDKYNFRINKFINKVNTGCSSCTSCSGCF